MQLLLLKLSGKLRTKLSSLFFLCIYIFYTYLPIFKYIYLYFSLYKNGHNHFICRKHMKTHGISLPSLKPYTCTVCGWKFVQKFNLKKHMWAHSIEVRNYPSCSKFSSYEDVSLSQNCCPDFE